MVFNMQKLANLLLSSNDKLSLFVFFGLLSLDSLADWTDQSHMIANYGEEGVVRALGNDPVLFRH